MSRHEVKVGNATYYIGRYDPFLGLEILGDLQQQFVAPILSTMTPGADVMGAIISGLGQVSGKMDGRTLAATAKRLLHPDYISVSIGSGEPRRLDEATQKMVMAGPEDLIDLCVEVVLLNFRPFFERFKTRYGGALSLPAGQSAGSPLN